jgi:signal transduction histidine kinase
VGGLRTRLIAAFIVATVIPVAASVWIASTLLDRSLGYATTGEVDRLSRTLERTVRQFYQRERDSLRRDALEGRLVPQRFDVGGRPEWPAPVESFWESGDAERFGISGPGGDHIDFLRRDTAGVTVFTRDLGGIHMQELSAEFGRTRALVGSLDARDLHRGFTMTLLVLIGVVWLASLIPLVFLASRVSRPIEELTAGLSAFAAGDWERRIRSARTDEVGRAVAAFNHMAEQLRANRDRLVYLAQMSSWQSLARKMAHELKNSLTPIRLTVEEMVARQPNADRAFMAQAAGIVVAEIETLQRRVRAFSDFASDPPVRPAVLDVNSLVADRAALLQPAHPETTYDLRLEAPGPRAFAGADLVKGILTNLLENAAEAAGPRGTIRVVTAATRDGVVIEVHDSGRGLSPEAAATLFEPTITFKKHGMGLGLSIARKHALACGGDIVPIAGALGGAAFRVTLPAS